MNFYKIVAQTNPWIASRSPIFKGKTRVTLEVGLTLSEAQKILLDMYNNYYSDSRAYCRSWGMARMLSRHYSEGAYGRGSGSGFEYDSRYFFIEEDNTPFYFLKRIPVVLLYNSDAYKLGLRLKEEGSEISAYYYDGAAHDKLNKLGIEPKLTEDDSYSAYSEPEAIIDSTFQNFENEQCLSAGWVREYYALMNEAHRELAVTTDCFYEWNSVRKRFIDIIFNRISRGNEDLQDLESEWINICASYSSPYDDDDISFNALVEEARRWTY